MPCNDFTLPRAGGSETSASEFPGGGVGGGRGSPRPPGPPPAGGGRATPPPARAGGGSSDRSAKDAATTLPEGSCLAFDPPARGRVKSVTGRQVET